MIEGIIEFSASAVQMFIWIWFVTKFFGLKDNTYKIWPYFTWFLVTFELVMINHIIPYDGLLAGIMSITVILYSQICLKGNLYFHIFISIFSTSIIFALAGGSLLFFSFFAGLNMNQMITELTVWRMLVFVSCRILEYVIFRAIIRINNEYKLTRKEWTLFISMPLITWIAVILMMNAAILQPDIQPYMFLLNVLIAFIDLLIYYFMIKIKEDANAAAELELLKLQYDNIKSAEANMQALYDSTYSVKHDLEKHFLAIKAMAQAHKDSDIENYAENVIRHDLDMVQKLVFTNDDVFNAVINTRLEICRQKGIFPGISISNEAVMHIHSEDTAVLFGNILDNAIEAAELSKEKIILMTVKLQGEYVSVCVENSYNAEFSGAGHETAKQNKREHGYGLNNIQRIVDKYDGMMQCTNEENNMFCCDVLLRKIS